MKFILDVLKVMFPMVAIAVVLVALVAWASVHMTSLVIAIIAMPVVWAVIEVSKLNSIEPHHDSRPGSHYEISHRKDK